MSSVTKRIRLGAAIALPMRIAVAANAAILEMIRISVDSRITRLREHDAASGQGLFQSLCAAIVSRGKSPITAERRRRLQPTRTQYFQSLRRVTTIRLTQRR